MRLCTIALCVLLVLEGCAAAGPCCNQAPGTCGLTLGEPMTNAPPAPRGPRIDYYIGLAALTAGVASTAIGSGYAYNGWRERDQGNHGARNSAVLLDKADANDERAVVGFGIGIPLMVLGAVLLFVNPPERGPLPKVPLPASGLFGDPQPSSDILPGQGAAAVESPARSGKAVTP